MKTEWLHRKKCKWLIIFYNGWGMDSTPFKPLLSEKYDVLGCYNYSDDSYRIDIGEYAKVYERMYLIGWSMGVAYGQRHFQDVAEYFYKTVAVNGTLRPVDELHGIPKDICRATLESLDEEALVKFYRRMCRSSSVLKIFMDHRPQRTIDDIKDELAAIITDPQIHDGENPIYTDTIISDKDMIIPTRNQVRFWTMNQTKVKRLENSHFPFYLWKSWDELLEYIG